MEGLTVGTLGQAGNTSASKKQGSYGVRKLMRDGAQYRMAKNYPKQSRQSDGVARTE